MVNQLRVLHVIQVFDLKGLFGEGHAFFGQLNRFSFNVDLIAIAFFETFDETVSGQIQVRRLTLSTGDDQWCTRFIDQNGVDFIDQRHVERTQNAFSYTSHHVVTQVIKPGFGVGGVGNVAFVGFTLFAGCHATQVQPDG